MRVLGIEGTAWAASAAVYDTDDGSVVIETDPYQPDSGGIHPREAAEHMSEAIPRVVETALEHARGLATGEGTGGDAREADGPAVDAVAFSRGPGLGPCLRIVGTAARALAQRLDVPLVGVNHMVAHLEIGRHRSGFESPVCLNASGANAHVLGYRNGRYRVLGETMDTGVGNALDKFTRHVGWTHPGGPKVERHARQGEYVDLPYVVKGMDFSFSGIMSAAKDAYDDGTPVEDVCKGLQETVFAMLTEVSERALSLTGSDQLVLGGGVGQNDRLQAMLETMCDQRGAAFHAPEDRFLRDNAGMIAVLGAKMYEAGATIAIEDSRIDPDFRPDEVDVVWKGGESVTRTVEAGDRVQGAEATVEIGPDRVHKRRLPRSYRHPSLDERLRRRRTREEARLTSHARRQGVPTPLVHDVDLAETTVLFQRVGAADLREHLEEGYVRDVGEHLATIHGAGFVHGDPTTRNVRVSGPDAGAEPESGGHAGGNPAGSTATDRTFLIDFGLGYHTESVEDHAMDLHVFAQSLAGTADEPDRLQAVLEEAYAERGDPAVVEQLREIEGRGRYQ